MARALPDKAQSHSDSSEEDARLLQYDPAHERDGSGLASAWGDSGNLQVEDAVDADRDMVVASLTVRKGEDMRGFCS